MNKGEFLGRLKELLSDLSAGEREEALLYYEEYFADAGEENEADVLASLVSPEQVARQIKEGLGKTEEGLFTENGYREKAESDNPPDVYAKVGKENIRQENRSGAERQEYTYGQNGYSSNAGGQDAYQQNTYGQEGYGPNTGGQNAYRQNTYGQEGYGRNANRQNAYQQNKYNQNGYNQNANGMGGNVSAKQKKKSSMSNGTVILLVILGILASPVILVLGVALLGIVISLFAAVLAVMLGAAAVVLCFLAVGIVLFITGFTMIFAKPFAGMIVLGVGCIMIAVFLLSMALLVAIFGRFFPWLIREVESFGKYLKRKWNARKKGGEMV